jgi:hypothetical protein
LRLEKGKAVRLVKGYADNAALRARRALALKTAYGRFPAFPFS